MAELRAKGPSDPVLLALASATYLTMGEDAVTPDDLGAVKIGPGELSVLAQSRASRATAILDDHQARQAAVRFGIQIIGTLGLIARAKSTGILTSARPLIEAIARNGMLLSRRVTDDLLRRLGE